MVTIDDLGQTIICIVFHADDGAANFRATLKRATERGAKVTIVVVSDNRGDNGFNLSEIRKQEEILGWKLDNITDVRFLDSYPDGEIAKHKARLIHELAQLITEFQPTAVFTFDPDNGLTGHEDHREGADCVEKAIRMAKCRCLMVCAAITGQWLTEVMPALRDLAQAIYTGVPLLAIPDSQLALDVRLSDEELTAKVAIVMAHESQMNPLLKKLASVGGLDFLINKWYRREAFTIRRPYHPLCLY